MAGKGLLQKIRGETIWHWREYGTANVLNNQSRKLYNPGRGAGAGGMVGYSIKQDAATKVGEKIILDEI